MSAKRTSLLQGCPSLVRQLTRAQEMPRLMATLVKPDVVPMKNLAFLIRYRSISSDLNVLRE
ncbi:hypothetical protein ACVWXO_006483 [Bradyrhizobium sp. LM2.7]